MLPNGNQKRQPEAAIKTAIEAAKENGAGSEKQEARSEKREAGSRKQEAGSRKREARSEKQGAVKRKKITPFGSTATRGALN